VRFAPRTHRLRGWIIDFPSQVPHRPLDYPELFLKAGPERARVLNPNKTLLPSLKVEVHQVLALDVKLFLNSRKYGLSCWPSLFTFLIHDIHRYSIQFLNKAMSKTMIRKG